MRNLLFLLSLSVLVSTTACRDDGGDDNPGTPDATVDPNIDATVGGSTTIYDIQAESMAVGTAVDVKSVVVTAIDTFGTRTGGMYVQEEAGGELSGVYVFVPAAVSGTVAVGDLVDISGGVKDEFALDADMSGKTLTEISPAQGGTITVTKVGTGTIPTPPVIDPVLLAGSDAEAEKWEGVPITFEGVQYLETTRTDEPAEISVTGPYRVGGSLAELDVDAVVGTCYSSITGIGDYFFSYKILPTKAADIVLDVSGASCAPIPDSTVVNAQNGGVAVDAVIKLNDVVVTAISADGESYWVQDNGVAAAFNGLYVFRRTDDGPLPVEIVVGNVITITGALSEFSGELTELVNSTVLSSNGTAVVTTLESISIDDLATIGDYESVLVDIPGAVVVTGADPGCTEFCTITLATGGAPLFANEDIFGTFTATAGECYSIQAVMHYDTFNDRITALPLSDGMDRNGTGCPQ